MHGVGTTGRDGKYNAFRTQLANQRAKSEGAQEEIAIEFNWALSAGESFYNPAATASARFGDPGKSSENLSTPGMSTQHWFAAKKLAITILSLRKVLDKENPGEPINIVSHSQGTDISIAALMILKEQGYTKKDIGVGSLALMASPLDTEDAVTSGHQTHKYIANAAGMIGGKMVWYSSQSDLVLGLKKGSIGLNGIGTKPFEGDIVKNSYPRNVGHLDYWDAKWISENKEDFGYLFSKKGADNPALSNTTRNNVKELNKWAMDWTGSMHQDKDTRTFIYQGFKVPPK